MTDTVENVDAATVSDCFYTLSYGTHVVETTGLYCDEYIYGTTGYNEEGNQYFRLFHAAVGTVVEVMADSETRWSAVENENGERKMADQLLQRALREAHTFRKSFNEEREKYLEADQELWRYKNDFARFNDMLNEFADSGHYGKMCSDYEAQLERWNEQLNVLKFVGRPQDHAVRVILHGQTCWISQLAHSYEEARNIVRHLSTRQLLTKIAEGNNDLYSLDVVIPDEPYGAWQVERDDDEPPF